MAGAIALLLVTFSQNVAMCQEVAPPGPSTPAAGSPMGDQNPATSETAEAEPGWGFGGWADFFTVWNFNDPFNGRNGLRFFDTPSARGLHFGEVDAWVERRRSPIGFRAEFNIGPNARLNNAYEPSRSDFWESFRELAVSANLDRSGRTSLTFGKQVTPAGLEEVQPHERDLHSVGYIYALASPNYYFGPRLHHDLNETDYVELHAFRGWDAVGAPGHAPGYGFTYNRAFGKSLSGALTFLSGHDSDGTGQSGRRNLLDVYLINDRGGRWKHSVNFELNTQANVLTAPGRRESAAWIGAAVGTRYRLDGKRFLSARLDWFRDDSGYLTGAPGTAVAFTAGHAWELHRHLQARVEFRHDFSGGANFFARRGPRSFGTNQSTLQASVIAHF